MKGIIIQNGIQFSCTLHGEFWRQGEAINGFLEISPPALEVNVILAQGSLKKIQAKDTDAFSIIEKHQFQNVNKQDFSFHLSADALLTEKVKSLYILYGVGDDLSTYGNLQLNIGPVKIFESFLGVFDTFLKFKTKTLKSHKTGEVEAKIAIPASKNYSNLNSLTLFLRKQAEDLLLKYQFTLTKVNYVDGDAKLEKQKTTLEDILTPKDYLIYGEAVNQDAIVKSIENILAQVKQKNMFT